MIDFTGRTVVLTGAAGGLGRPTALAFARAGARVLALDHDRMAAAALTEAAGKLPLEIVEADLADLAALPARIAGLAEESGGIDILINNAAIYPAKPIEAYSIEEFQAIQRVNVDAAVVLAQAVLPGMRRKRRGRIVNVTSITFYGGWANLMPYVASKGALVGLTRAWARELGPDGITVNAISPGAFPTAAESIHPDPEGYGRFVLDHQSLKRRGRPEDIADVMMFLASDMSSFITGQTINVDGGWVMH